MATNNKFFNGVNQFLDKHAPEVLVSVWGLAGALFGFLISDPDVGNMVYEAGFKGVKKIGKALTDNIHITFGNGNTRIAVEGGNSSKAGNSYYDWRIQRDRMDHEERMAEIRFRNHAPDLNAEGTVE